jgi:transglutaminase-like putative cysteine protease
MRKTYLLSMIFFLLLAPLLSSSAQARWATYEDAHAEIEFSTSDVTVDKDGKIEEIVEKQIKILDETGRNLFGVERIHFNESIEKIDIIEAKTIVDGKEHPVPKEMIETKPLASEISGFDQLFQIFISYPHVGVGTKLYLKYKVQILKQPLPNYFALKYFYGQGAYWKKFAIKLKSELPFHMMVNDPKERLVIKQCKEGKYYKLDITSHKPAYDEIMNEAPTNQVPNNLKTWVSISTFDSYEDFSKATAKDYEEVLNQELPPLQESIKKAAASLSNPVDQINKVTSLLSEKIRYMGDWRTTEGRFSPRSLKAVAESGVGDCKDYSASTAAILNSLGYKARIAMVMRGIHYISPQKSLPGFSMFNHAIVKVIAKDGKVFWSDPTNFVSMADGIFPDISERPALVLDTKDPSYETIPSINHQHSKMDIKGNMEVKENDILKTEGELKLTGESAQDFTGAALSHSLQAIEEGTILNLSGEACPLKKKVILPPLDSRIVKDIVISYSYEQENHLLLTNMGSGILFNFFWANNFIDTSMTQEGTTFLGLPVTLHKTITIKNVDAEQAKTVAYEFKSPWVEAKRECSLSDRGIEMIETITILKSFITAEEVKSKQFQELRQTIKKYCSKIALIISRLPGESTKKVSETPLPRGDDKAA